MGARPLSVLTQRLLRDIIHRALVGRVRENLAASGVEADVRLHLSATDHERAGVDLGRRGVSSPIMIDSWSIQGWMRYADGGGLTEQGRAKREAVRLRAAEWFAQDVAVGEIAWRLRVSTNAVYVWRRRWRAGGPAALVSKGPGGSSRRLDEQRKIVWLGCWRKARPCMGSVRTSGGRWRGWLI